MIQMSLLKKYSIYLNYLDTLTPYCLRDLVNLVIVYKKCQLFNLGLGCKIISVAIY